MNNSTTSSLVKQTVRCLAGSTASPWRKRAEYVFSHLNKVLNSVGVHGYPCLSRLSGQASGTANPDSFLQRPCWDANGCWNRPGARRGVDDELAEFLPRLQSTRSGTHHRANNDFECSLMKATSTAGQCDRLKTH